MEPGRRGRFIAPWGGAREIVGGWRGKSLVVVIGEIVGGCDWENRWWLAREIVGGWRGKSLVVVIGEIVGGCDWENRWWL
jgi:outer membrane lipoprotein SlyB